MSPEVLAMINRVISREGGDKFTNHPADKGGPTKFGITQNTLKEWRQKDVSVDEVVLLTIDEARKIYYHNYFVTPGFDKFPPQIQELLFDAAVNHGVYGATVQLQKAVGVTADGVIGPKTLEAIAKMDYGKLWRSLLAERLSYYGKIITNNPSQAVFAHGWMNRVGELLRQGA